MPEVNRFVLMRDKYDSDKDYSAVLAEMIQTLIKNDQEVFVTEEEFGIIVIEYLPRNFMYGGASFVPVELEEYQDLCAARRAKKTNEDEGLPF